MATISNRNNKWHVRVRRSGQPDATKTFLIRTDPEKSEFKLLFVTLEK